MTRYTHGHGGDPILSSQGFEMESDKGGVLGLGELVCRGARPSPLQPALIRGSPYISIQTLYDLPTTTRSAQQSGGMATACFLKGFE
jgi:hypothetical protein